MPRSMKLVPSAMATTFIALVFMLLPPWTCLLLIDGGCASNVHGERNITTMAMKSAAIADSSNFVDHAIYYTL
jgi:hypothetical protein